MKDSRKKDESGYNEGMDIIMIKRKTEIAESKETTESQQMY